MSDYNKLLRMYRRDCERGVKTPRLVIDDLIQASQSKIEQLEQREKELETKVIDDLGCWLCRDMEKDMKKHLLFTEQAQALNIIKDVAGRIKNYRGSRLDRA